MICSHCGKPEGTLKEEIAKLHGRGMTPKQIRDELARQGWRKERSQQLPTIHHYLRIHLSVEPNR